jgi:hypothetical protein
VSIQGNLLQCQMGVEQVFFIIVIIIIFQGNLLQCQKGIERIIVTGLLLLLFIIIILFVL